MIRNDNRNICTFHTVVQGLFHLQIAGLVLCITAVMAAPSSLFLLLLLVTIAFSRSHSTDRTTRELQEREREERRKDRTRNQDRQPRSVSTLKVLDFFDDGDQEPDNNGEYTGATLEAGFLPQSFTICAAFMVEALTTEASTIFMFLLLDNGGYNWIGSVQPCEFLDCN